MIEVKSIKGDSGFSLVELVTFLTIAACAAAVSVPMISGGMRSWQLAADARNIANTLASAKFSSSAQTTRCRLSFNLSRNSWWLEKYNRGTGSYELQGAVKELSAGLANSGITFKRSSSGAPPGFPTDSSATITFNSRGIPVDAAGVPTPANVVYLSSGQADYAVTVSLTGKVQLWKNQSSQWVTQ